MRFGLKQSIYNAWRLVFLIFIYKLSINNIFLVNFHNNVILERSLRVFNRKIILLSIIFLLFINQAFAQDDGTKGFEEMSLEELLNVEIVTATKQAQKISEAPAIVTVITAKQMEEMGARRLADVLYLIPGVDRGYSPTGFTPYGEIINFRGLAKPVQGNERTLLLIDGYPLNNVWLGQHSISEDIPLSVIDRIEVVRGPGSALYGANAFTGVINIITKRGSDESLPVKAGVKYGSFNTKAYSFFYRNSESDLKSVIDISYYKTDGDELWIENDATPPDTIVGHLSGPLSGYTDGEEKEVNTIFVKLKYKPATVRLLYSRYFMSYGLSAVNTLIKRGNPYENHRFFTGVDLNYGDFTFKTFANHSVWDARINLYDRNFAGLPDGMITAGEVLELSYGASLEYSRKLFANNNLTAGVSFNQDKLEMLEWENNYLSPEGVWQEGPEWLIDGEQDVYNTAFYVQDIWQPVDLLEMTAGFRYDQHEVYSGVFSPRLGLVVKPLKDTHLKLLYGEAFRAPTIDELYHSVTTLWGGNPDLEPENIQTIEAALEYSWKDKLSTRLNYFYNNITDLVARDEKMDPPKLWKNLDEAKIWGVEAEFKVIPMDMAQFEINYSYQKGKDEDLLDVPENKGNFIARVYPMQKTSLFLSASYLGERDTYSGNTLNALMLVNATVNYDIFKDWRASLSGYNLTDEDYVEPGAVVDYPRPGRSFIVSLEHKF